MAIPRITDLNQMDSTEVLLAIATRDVEASEAFLEKYRTHQAELKGQPFEKGEYQGVTYWVQPAESEFGNDTYLALFNDFVVFATSEDALFGAIDRVQSGGESLADNEKFQSVLNALPANAALFAFIDYSAFIELAMEEAPAQLEPEQLSQLQALEGVGMALVLQPDGVQINAAVQLDKEKLPASAQAALGRPGSPNAILTRIPSDAIGFYNGYDLRSIWQQIREGLAVNPDFERQLADFEAETGLSLDEDLFGWMTGEFALVLTQAQPTSELGPPLGGYLLIGTDDVNLAQNKVADLIDLLTQEMFLEFESETIGGVEMQVLTDPTTGGVMGGYGFWDDYLIAGYLEDALTAAFAAPDEPIRNSPHFKAVADRLPAKNYGYLYLDIDVGQRLLERQLSELDRAEYEENVRPFVEPLRAFGAAAEAGSAQTGIQKVTMFLLITEE